MTFSRQLRLLIAAAIISITAIFASAMYSMGEVYDKANACNENTQPSVILLDKAKSAFFKIRIAVWTHISNEDPKVDIELDKKIAELKTELANQLNLYEKEFIADDVDKKMLNDDKEAVAKGYDFFEKVLMLSRANKDKEARDLMMANLSIPQEVSRVIDEHLNYNLILSSRGANDAVSQKHSANITMIAIFVIFLIAMFLLSRMISKNVIGGLELITDTLKNAATTRDFAKTVQVDETSLHGETGEVIKSVNVLLDAVARASKAKSAFLANMSHEIRTPLNAVIGLASIMLKTNMSNKQEEYCEKILSSSKILLSILNDILDLSKIEAGKMDIERTAFEIRTVTEKLETIFTYSAKTAGLKFELSVDHKIPRYVMGDPLRLHQVLANLLSNAIKFTHDGGVFLAVSVVSKDESKIGLVFEIKDTGIGIAADKLDKLFAEFTQADTSTTRRFGGTGLGLAIAKKLVTMMGGQIDVQSVEGLGSKFSVTLELDLPTDDELPNVQKGIEFLSHINILLVDDDEVTLHLLEEQFKKFGFKYEYTISPLKAIEMVKSASSPFDLILLDYKMPELNGILTMKRIFEDEGLTQKPKIIMFSVVEDKQVKEAAFNSGASDFLQKPLSQSEILDSILKVFGVGLKNRNGDTAKKIKYDLSGLKVLVVEDNDVNLQITLEMLFMASIETQYALNGQEAVDILQEKKEGYFDLVLMDMQMPVMDGIEATKYIREKLAYKKLPIVALTANAFDSDVKHCIMAGMNDHIAKPIDYEELCYVVAKWSGREALKTVAEEKPSQSLSQTAGGDESVMDIEGAVARFAGNVEIYKKMVALFIEKNDKVGLKIKEVYKSADMQSARIEAHTLKGASAGVGAMQISALAKSIEEKIKEGASVEHDVFDRIDAAMQRFVEHAMQTLQSKS